MRGYQWPAFDLGGFGGHGGMGGLGGYPVWDSGFDTPYYDVPGSVEQATRSHVEAQTEFEKAKEKYEEAKKKFEECEKKAYADFAPVPVEKAEQMLNLAKHRAGGWWN
ncbi:hypothetical protein J4E85_009525 [Alternaria conjuncta]|uniref:uncharacterized protein n=1 Tax=Alternaria conjuncta TaxID=181017 RepID=UPI0022204139|nr:uncharacterized protein J4E85_009525 [Alternaria conjuncta]KAI4919267.1 hypothetical protein J4E85_009525 [Alternaria conjuncta]